MEKWRRVTDGTVIGSNARDAFSLCCCLLSGARSAPEHSSFLKACSRWALNESRENHLARGLLRHRGLPSFSEDAPQLGHIWFVWFDCDSRGFGCGSWWRGLLARWWWWWGGNATGSLPLSDARAFWCGTAPNHTPSVISTADSSTSDAAAWAVKP